MEVDMDEAAPPNRWKKLPEKLETSTWPKMLSFIGEGYLMYFMVVKWNRISGVVVILGYELKKEDSWLASHLQEQN
jgi:hypothetical protein